MNDVQTGLVFIFTIGLCLVLGCRYGIEGVGWALMLVPFGGWLIIRKHL